MKFLRTNSIMISVRNISKTFTQNNILTVLNNINLEVKSSEIISIVGASGAGKTTLLNIIGTLEKPDSGSVLIDNADVTNLKDKELSNFRNQNIGFIFQFHHLLPEFTALENVCLPALIKGGNKVEIEKRAIEILDLLKVADRKNSKSTTLSGGEQQRVAVARALINNPKVILADEPSGNLDSLHAEQLHDLFFELRNTLGQTFIIVTHNELLANRADKKYTIKDGNLLQ
jgi:lipoprotein-releasing system ATP-binding protein